MWQALVSHIMTTVLLGDRQSLVVSRGLCIDVPFVAVCIFSVDFCGHWLVIITTAVL